ncbi:MAG: cation-translocating P-type ATPase [Methyloceanibacter sp.]
MPERPHAASVVDVLRQLQVDPGLGLTGHEAALRLKRHGPNTLLMHPRVTAPAILPKQLRSPVVWLLATAAVIAALFGEWTEAIAILLVLAINTAIGFVTELRAVRSMEALRKLGSRASRVMRDGKLKILPAEQIVPGDIVLLESGDVVTADMRLVQGNTLCCDESTLTGESAPVEKNTTTVAEDAVVADRTSMVHKGTAITRGAGIGVAMGLRGTEVAREAAATSRRCLREHRGSDPRGARHLQQHPPLPRVPPVLQPPRDPREPLLGKPQWPLIAGGSVLLTMSTLGALVIGRYWLGLEGDALVTVSFLTLAFAQLWHVFNMRGSGSRILSNTVTRNPSVWMAIALCIAILIIAVYWAPFAQALHITAPGRAGWAMILGLSLAPLVFGPLLAATAGALQRRGRWPKSPRLPVGWSSQI